MTNPNGLFKQELGHFIVKTLPFEDDIVRTTLILSETKYSERTGNWNQFFKKNLYISKEENPDLLFMKETM